MSAPDGLRIGEFARRVGVSAAVLRAWERRYGLLSPVRSDGGFRLYTATDQARVTRMLDGLSRGLSAAQAAAAALAAERPTTGLLRDAAERLFEAIRAYDEAEVQALLDEALAAFGLEAVLRELIVPSLARIGSEWEQGTLGVGQEHFASNLIRSRLLSLARFWGRGSGPVALLACAPGERHDISLLAFGLVLRSHGWRIVFLGADTPVANVAEAAAITGPSLTVISSFSPELLLAEAAALTELAAGVPVALSGPGATTEVATALGLPRLDGDLVTAAGEAAQGAGA